MAIITGNTFAVKDQLKALGGSWKPALKGWLVPDAKADEARAIVASAGPAKPSKATHYRAGRACATCGQKINYGVYCGKCEFSY